MEKYIYDEDIKPNDKHPIRDTILEITILVSILAFIGGTIFYATTTAVPYDTVIAVEETHK